jgi:hypothetical protein
LVESEHGRAWAQDYVLKMPGMERAIAEQVLRRLHAAQGTLYAGGNVDCVRPVLTEDIEWHVPGRNSIAGDYHGIEAVLGYFVRRRDLAKGTFRMQPGELMVGDGDHASVLTEGTAVIAGTERCWSTLGLYRIRGQRVAACWLLPLQPDVFDAIWNA